LRASCPTDRPVAAPLACTQFRDGLALGRWLLCRRGEEESAFWEGKSPDSPSPVSRSCRADRRRDSERSEFHFRSRKRRTGSEARALGPCLGIEPHRQLQLTTRTGAGLFSARSTAIAGATTASMWSVSSDLSSRHPRPPGTCLAIARATCRSRSGKPRCRSRCSTTFRKTRRRQADGAGREEQIRRLWDHDGSTATLFLTCGETKSGDLEGENDAGGGTRTPDTRIMILSGRLPMGSAGPRFGAAEPITRRRRPPRLPSSSGGSLPTPCPPRRRESRRRRPRRQSGGRRC
jgi:hypothetical protein